MRVCVYEWVGGKVVGWWGTVGGKETSLNDMFSSGSSPHNWPERDSEGSCRAECRGGEG